MNSQTNQKDAWQDNPACQANSHQLKSPCAYYLLMCVCVCLWLRLAIRDRGLTETRKKAGVFETDLGWLRGDALIRSRAWPLKFSSMKCTPSQRVNQTINEALCRLGGVVTQWQAVAGKGFWEEQSCHTWTNPPHLHWSPLLWPRASHRHSYHSDAMAHPTPFSPLLSYSLPFTWCCRGIWDIQWKHSYARTYVHTDTHTIWRNISQNG